jgi:hypothetical protein
MQAGDRGIARSFRGLLRENCLAIAIFALLGVFLWQAASVEFKFRGNWTALFLSGEQYPIPPSLAGDGVYRFRRTPGYDGQFYHFIAHDPLLRTDAAEYVDSPELRWRRILVPGLAHLLAFGRMDWIDGAYIAVVLASVSVGVFWLALYARVYELPAYFGLAFLAVPAVLVSIERLTVDVALAALAVGFIYHARRGPDWAFYTILILAPLARETGIGFTIAAAAFSVYRRKWRRAGLELATALPFAAWAIYVHQNTPSKEHVWGTLVPLSGLFTRSIHPIDWEGSRGAVYAATQDAIALAGFWAALLLLAVVFRRRPLTLLHAAIGVFAGFTVFLGAPSVWEESIAFSRVLSPFIVWLMMFGIAHQSWWMALPLALATTRTAYEFLHRTMETVLAFRAQL